MKSRETAILVIRFLGWLMLLATLGTLALTAFGKAAPEWIKDVVLVSIGALSALLAKTEVSGPEMPSGQLTVTPLEVSQDEVHPN